MSRGLVPSVPSIWLIGVVWTLALTATTSAEPVFGDIFSLHQPDGTGLRVRVWGDEFYQVVESLDGYALVRDPSTDSICYARLGDGGSEFVSTGVVVADRPPADLGLVRHIRVNRDSVRTKVRAVRARSSIGATDRNMSSVKGLARRTTTVGEVEGICLLIDFSDETATIAPSMVDRFCNEIGYNGFGNNGSVRDYFFDVSDGRLTYTNYVTPTYYRAVHSKNYYIDPHVPQGIRARELVLEALIALDDTGFDFSQYDSNDDGFVDAVSCFYAGPRRSNWGSGLWPHSWTVGFSADGVLTDKYAIIDMADDDTGDVLRLSTFCHENGHVLGDWPDLYDLEFDSKGVGNYCIMGGNENYTSHANPQEPCAYVKGLSGWSTTIALTEPQQNLSLWAGTNLFYTYVHPTSPNEYYILENRQASGRDSGLPDSGLAIWHVDTLGSNDNQEMTPASHYEVTLVQADGNWDLEQNRNRGDATDLWASPSYPVCGPHTNPNTDWWDGTPSRLHVRQISSSGPKMTFDFTVGEDCNGNLVPDYLDIVNGFSEDCQPDGIPDECQLADDDCDGNSVPDACELPGRDCNRNGALDICDIAGGVSVDCNGNARPDECDVASGTSQDCNGNSVPDECDVSGGTSLDCQPDEIPDECQLVGNDCDGNSVPDTCELSGQDCNGNGKLDVCDVADGTSLDCQPDGVPDECQLSGNDCNGNSVPDGCELPSEDCNRNRVLDVCDIAGGTSADCNGNATPDECDVESGISDDCNGNNVPDECDVSGGTSLDCQPDEIPDECQLVGNDCDGNGVPDMCELSGLDCNGNGILDVCDVAGGTSLDCQPDGVPDECQLSGNDCDGNSVPDTCELPGGDCNGNNMLDVCDIAGGTSLDCQPDGVPDECQLSGNDCDGNSVPDTCELPGGDCNGNSVLDVCDIAGGTSSDCNRNDRPDECDVSSGTSEDCNSNGAPDECDIGGGVSLDCQADGVPDECQLSGNDCDGNNVPDTCELPGMDCNGNGVLDVCDVAGGTSADCQPDGVPDECQLSGNDCDGNSVPDTCELSGRDCNGNGVLDVCDIAGGTSTDCNFNQRPDDCDIASGDSDDCNSNGAPDECDIGGGTSLDCQPDGVPDECQVSGNDCDGSSVPDACELPGRDCNGNGVLDVCDLAGGTSADCNLNQRPDECDIALGGSDDCNSNGVPDECDIGGGASLDCQPDGVPDECQVSGNDCDGNNVPDACEMPGGDCNGNSVLDVCDIAGGSSADCNLNERPDECDLASGGSEDCNGNGLPDECDIGEQTSLDCQGDGIPDECQLQGNDCDGSNVPDSCELVGRDCNGNGGLDECDIASGASEDGNANTIPDECEREPCAIEESTKLTALDADANDLFGVAVSAHGDAVLMGAYGDKTHGPRSGSAYIYRFGNSTWAQEAKLIASDSSPQAFFGYAVSLFGEVAVIGAFEARTTTDSGAAYVFRFDGSSWAEQQKLIPSIRQASQAFGISVDAYGDVILVGAYQEDSAGPDAGAAYAFHWNGVQWVEQQRLLGGAAMAYDNLGWAVAVFGNVAVIGAPGADDRGDSAGAAYVFRFDGANWIEEQRLLASDGATGDQFGSAAAIWGTTLLIGAYSDDAGGQNADAGSAYIFRFDGVEWTQRHKIVAWDGASGDWFGRSVGLSDGTAVVGAWHDDDNGSDSGSAYVFDVSGSVPLPRAKLSAFDGASSDGFARTIAISNTGMVVSGASQNGEYGFHAGATYAFHGLTEDCNANYAIDYCDIVDGISEDGDGNSIPDECEVAGPGDFDADGDVDLDDYRAFVECAAGPGVALDPGQSASASCLDAFDFDDDDDNDLMDFSILQAVIR